MKSRILNVSPRAYLRDLDSENVLPPIVRTGYNGSLGYEPSTPFDDTTTIINETQVMLAPYMVTASLAGFSTGTLFITSSYKDRSAYLSRPVVNDPISPYQESFNTSPFSIGTSRNTGFPAEIYPGFTSSAENRLAISIDITPTSDFVNTRISRDDSLLDAAGEFYDNPKSGFIYYNFANHQWDNIGLNDPSTGVDLSYTSQLTSSSGRISDGNRRVMSQFCSTPGVAYKVSGTLADRMSDELNSINKLRTYGYDFIGYPTSFFEGPYAPRYHATKDQVLKLSNYIKHPIVCDRIQVSLPVTFKRIQDPNSVADADFGFGHDVNNHTFFLYVQRRTQATADSVTDVSSSIRYLIANKSFQSVNRNSFPANLRTSITAGTIRLGDTNDSLSVISTLTRQTASSAGARVVQQGSFQVNMSFRPRVYDQFYGSVSRLSAFDNTAVDDSEVLVRNFWRGGQYASGSVDTISTWSIFNPTHNRMRGFNTGSQQDASASIAPGRSIIRSTWLARTGTFTTDDLNPNTCEMASKYFPNIEDYPYTETPVILYPEDELIIGIDSGVYPVLTSLSPTAGGVDRSVLSVTGSSLTLRSAPAKIILFGTQVQQDHEIPVMLNQHLGSAAVSEDIHYNNVVTDQFDMLPRISLSSSYVDNIFNRSNGFGYDGVVGTYTHFTNRSPYDTLGVGYEEYEKSYWNGSLQRNVRFFSDDVVYYDTMTPEPANLALGILSASINATGTYIPAGGGSIDFPPNTIKIIYDSSAPEALGFSFNNNRPSSSTDNRILSRSFTYETCTQTTKRYRDLSIVYEYPVTIFKNQRLVTNDNARFVLYYNGFYPLNTNTILAKNYTGAASLRYGYMNPRLIGPSWVFRRDHYGQVRDMLEQSRDAKVHYIDNLGLPHVSRSPVLAVFVSASTDIVVDGTATQCSNLSIECTSSVPFTDMYRARNRSATLPAYTAKFGVNNLIFGVTGSSRIQ